jgi:hypothetical protein
MSTLKATNLQSPSAVNPAIVLAADGSATAQISSINGGPLAGFRNAIINGNFDIWQRGTSFTGDEYGADRWVNGRLGSSCTMSRQAFALGQTDVPGEPTYFCRMAVTSVAGAGNYVVIQQRIESVRTFAGQTVTVSFRAKADAAKPIAVELAQVFGTGGSPSAVVTALGVAKTTLSTSWQKVTVTATLPSISGKTIGNDGNDFFTLVIWLDAGSTYNSRTSTLGQQSGTFDIAQVQIEAGPVATPFERRPYGTELALCQRYYWIGFHAAYVFAASNTNVMMIAYPVSMRAAPTGSWTPTSSVNVAAFSVASMTTLGARSILASSAAGAGDWVGTVSFGAEL